MLDKISFDFASLPNETKDLRSEVREFLETEVTIGTFRPHEGDGFDLDFSKRVGKKGWIGMTWPKQYGGQERSFLERYVVTE